jgi:hypothetical protein
VVIHSYIVTLHFACMGTCMSPKRGRNGLIFAGGTQADPRIVFRRSNVKIRFLKNQVFRIGGTGTEMGTKTGHVNTSCTFN